MLWIATSRPSTSMVRVDPSEKQLLVMKPTKPGGQNNQTLDAAGVEADLGEGLNVL